MSGNAGQCFVVLPSHSDSDAVVYGRNSLTPVDVSEVLYFPATENTGQVECDGVAVAGCDTHAVILSKPVGVWGAESGANSKGVAMGIVWTANEPGNGFLSSTDLTRLCLERGSTAIDAVSVLGSLIGEHGSGNDGKSDDHFKHCYIICDTKEAWLINCVGQLWAAELISEGFRAIPQGLSVGTKIDKSSEDLGEKMKSLELWDGNGELNFAGVFAAEISLVSWPEATPPSDDSSFSLTQMFETLRSTDSGAKSSHVSMLNGSRASSHWLTATPNPIESVFKPFIFTVGARISPLTKLAEGNAETLLHKLHGQRNWSVVGELLQSLESTCVVEVNGFIGDHPGTPSGELDDLMKDCVEAEVKFYR